MLGYTARKSILVLGLLCLPFGTIFSQNESIVRKWNELLLHAIRTDFARPTVHARNLYHLSLAQYDCYQAFDPSASTFLLGKSIQGFSAPYNGFPVPNNIDSARHEAISFASYRILKHRFQNSPGYTGVLFKIDSLMSAYNYNTADTTTDYASGRSAALGNYVAQQVILYGHQDGSNEQNDYANLHYTATNPPIEVEEFGNPDIIDPDHWQAISLPVSIDQSGNIVASTPDHLSPEWGDVDPFAMDDSLITTYTRNNENYNVFLDPGAPAYLDTTDTLGLNSLYKWNFCMVSVWQSHLDTANGMMIDISPASRGNLTSYPQNKEDHPNFYDFFNGGVQQNTGHSINPATGNPYAPQIVPLADYARVLAEFWADGLDSETPPGHWFEIMHTVVDDPLFVRQWMGTGDTLSTLEYDVYAHFTLGGAVHDAAVAAWSVKGWYDYIRPVSALRYMAELGQSSDTSLTNFHPGGLPLISGYIEVVDANDPLAGTNQEHVGEIKLYTWKGPDYITDPETDMAGVGWILAKNWWPYQRPTFVTPPFAGYVSGHSTFSRTAAHIMTYMTGDPYFPGGIGEFHAEQNEFLEFEEGPSVDIYLQWATYQDAADECSLSRIWGGIHPPVDDIPGRLMADQLGSLTFNHANSFIQKRHPRIVEFISSDTELSIADQGTQFSISIKFDTIMDVTTSPQVSYIIDNPLQNALSTLGASWVNDSTYVIDYLVNNYPTSLSNIVVKIDSAKNLNGVLQTPQLFSQPFAIDTETPFVTSLISSDSIINDANVGNIYTILLNFNEVIDTASQPSFSFTDPQILNSIGFISGQSEWLTDTTYLAHFTVNDENVFYDTLALITSQVNDEFGNSIVEDTSLVPSLLDTQEPLVSSFTINDTLFNRQDFGFNALQVALVFSESMDTTSSPELSFKENGISFTNPFILNGLQSAWSSDTSCIIYYQLDNQEATHLNVTIVLDSLRDKAQNAPPSSALIDIFDLDTERPQVLNIQPNANPAFDDQVGSANFEIDLYFSEKMNISNLPVLQILDGQLPANDFSYSLFQSNWINDSTFKAAFNLTDSNLEKDSLSLVVNFAQDAFMNNQLIDTLENALSLDTKNPSLQAFNANSYSIDDQTQQLSVLYLFDEDMDQNTLPDIRFSDPLLNSLLIFNNSASQWYSANLYEGVYDIQNTTANTQNVFAILDDGKDLAGNVVNIDTMQSTFSFDLNGLGVSNKEPDQVFVIYPNPTEAALGFNILSPSNEEKIITVHDAAGKMIVEQTTTQKKIWINTTKWTGSTYFITIRNNGQLFTKKLVIK